MKKLNSVSSGNDIVYSPDTFRDNRIPPGQRATDKWPVLHHGQVPLIDISTWEFKIFGLVEKERTLDYKEFAALPQIKVNSDIHCVTGWSKLNNIWEGPGTTVLHQLITINSRAGFVIVHASGGFTTNIPINDFFQSDALFALKHDGKELTHEHGYPVRLIVPRLYFWKSAKWVTGIEFAEEDKPGFWESAGYHNHGDPWTEERYR